METEFNGLKNKRVETYSGRPLGRIIDAEIDLSNHTITKYVISPGRWLGLKQKLLISPNQIVEITDKKIIVEDAAVKETPRNAASEEISGLANSAAIGSRINYDG